jgi:hypothetical protein
MVRLGGNETYKRRCTEATDDGDPADVDRKVTGAGSTDEIASSADGTENIGQVGCKRNNAGQAGRGRLGSSHARHQNG